VNFRLADLVTPQSVHQFLRTNYAQQSWVRYKGKEHRFRGLADWGTLNTLLATLRFEFPRFRLARQGEFIPVENYTERIRTIANTSYEQIVVDRLLYELRDAATLIIDRVDQAHEPIRELAAALESELRAPVFVNMFASWSPVPGFDLHWDDQDVFVIQLEGRKHWQICEPTRQWPLHRDVLPSPKPKTTPVAEFDMTPGDVLYLPHGWWHSVSAVEGPSLHLTVGVEAHNGIDFMTWLVDLVRSRELFRRPVPCLEDERQQREYLASIRASWNELMASEEILDQFLTYVDGTSRSRPLFNLPDVLSTNSVLDKKTARIVLLAPRAAVAPAGDRFVLTALGRRWSFPSVTKPLIDALLSQDHVTVEQVIKLNVGVSEEQSAQVIFTLMRAGVLVLQ
jgi:ribosomal protein L16 Arg81 hydroxylase